MGAISANITLNYLKPEGKLDFKLLLPIAAGFFGLTQQQVQKNVVLKSIIEGYIVSYLFEVVRFSFIKNKTNEELTSNTFTNLAFKPPYLIVGSGELYVNEDLYVNDDLYVNELVSSEFEFQIEAEKLKENENSNNSNFMNLL